MSLDPRVQDALTSPDPFNRLRSLVQALHDQEQEQSAILELFEKTRRQPHQTGQDRDENVIMEIMDFLVGWCSPHMNLEQKNDTSR